MNPIISPLLAFAIFFPLLLIGQATRTYQSWAAFQQNVDIKAYGGQPFRLSAAAKVFLEDEGFSETRLYARIGGPNGKMLDFFQLDGDSITSKKWTTYTLTGIISKGAEHIQVGATIFGNGQFFFDNFKLEVQHSDGSWESIEMKNKGFEEGKVENKLPPSWTGNVRRIHDFTATVVDTTSQEGGFSYLIIGQRIPIPAELEEGAYPKLWTAFEQDINISSYRGQRFKLSAAVRVEQLTKGRAQLYTRVSNRDGRTVFFYNMRDRPITSPNWQRYEIEGSFSNDADEIAIGGLIYLGCRSYFDDFRLSVLNKNQRWEEIALNNADFEVPEITEEGPKAWQWLGERNPKFSEVVTQTAVNQGLNSLSIVGEGPSDPFLTASTIEPAVDSSALGDLSSRWDYLYPNLGISLKNIVWSIEEDNKGFIWLATSEGSLVKYDGTQFRYYYYNSSTTGARCNVTSIHAVEQRSLWLATSCGLVLFDLSRALFYQKESLKTALPEGEINSISREADGTIWITVEDGGGFQYFPKNDSIARLSIRPFKNSASIVESTIGYVYPISQDKLKLTDHFRLSDFIYDRVSHTLTPVPYNFLSSAGSTIVNVDSNTFWMGSIWGRGLSRYELDKGLFANYRTNGYVGASIGGAHRWYESRDVPPYHDSGLGLSSNDIHDLLYTRDRRLFVGTKNGLNLFLPEQNGFIQIEHQSIHPQANSGNIINDLLEDKTGNVWVATEAGLRIQWKNKNSFNYFEIPIQAIPNGEVEQRIDGITEWDDEQLLLWNSKEMYLYHTERKTIKALRSEDSIFQFLKDYPIVYVEKMEDGMLWIGTYYILAPGNYSLFRFDPQIGKVLGEYHYTGGNNGMTKYHTTSVVQQDSNIVWIATIDGLNKLDLRTQQFQHYQYSSIDSNGLTSNVLTNLYLDETGKLWVATDGAGLNLYDPTIDGFRRFIYDSGKDGTLSSNTIYDIQEDEKNRLWIATDNGLNRYDREEEKFLHYQRRQVQSDNTYFFLFNDHDGYLWSATKEELVKFDPDSTSFTFFNDKDGIASPITSYSGFKDDRGNLYFGGLTGVVYFAPEEINQRNPNVPNLALTEFILGDQVITPTNAEKILDQHISYTNSITLKHFQNEFTIKYVALDFANPGQNQYQVYLEGYDKQWRELGNRTEVTYSNLSSGGYTFRVKGSNNDGVWNEQGIALAITIRSPWYWAWWSKSLYVLLIAGIIYYLYSTQLQQQLEKAETDRLRELDEVKTRLYANITHEFRTPLTIILGMADKVVASPNQWLSHGISMIKRNGQNLLRLVNQMLDLSKLEAGKLQLNMTQSDVIPYLKYVMESFESLGALKDIKLHFHSDLKELMMDFDQDNLLNVVSNLLSNAIKFTDKGGDVYLLVGSREVEQSGKPIPDHPDNIRFLEFKVIDTGLGISPEKLPYIFDRFYQADSSVTRVGEGTGIGLALTKELVQLMGGEIQVKSILDKGSEFTVRLPRTTQASRQKQVNSISIKEEVSAFTHPRPTDDVEIDLAAASDSDADKPSLLIVEDNRDVVSYLVACLESDYRLEIAYDGEEGINKAFEIIPDIMISDIMMPKKDGFQLCHTLKNDIRTSHVPIILLTAKADVHAKIAGLRRGADAYLAKPFNEVELQVRMQQLLMLRQQLRAKYSGPDFLSTSVASGKDAKNSLEDEFIRKVRQAVEDHLDDFDFDVSRLCRAVGMSRTPVHNKLKALTGKSTTEFIRYIRLEKSRGLLLSTNLNISQISYETGFRNPTYFSTRFAALFGKSPTEYRESHLQ